MKNISPDVLIITQKEDPTADFLIPYLEQYALSWKRWDTGTLTHKEKAGMFLQNDHWEDFKISFPDQEEIYLHNTGVIWFRRPSANYVPYHVPTNDVALFINKECSSFITNFWKAASIPMVNNPIEGYAAADKGNQLTSAISLGLRVPKTYMGNDPHEIRKLWDATSGYMVVKPFLASVVHTTEETQRITYTTTVHEKDLDDHALSACPSIWQEKIPKKVEIRVTVVGDELFASEIHSQDNEFTREDWRNNLYDIPFLPHHLPFTIGQKCIDLVKSFHLHYGALDLILTPEGEYVFLENNPFGQWAWLQEQCGLPIAEAHCELFRTLINKSLVHQHRGQPIS